MLPGTSVCLALGVKEDDVIEKSIGWMQKTWTSSLSEVCGNRLSLSTYIGAEAAGFGFAVQAAPETFLYSLLQRILCGFLMTWCLAERCMHFHNVLKC